MHVVSQCFHVGKLFVRGDISLRIPIAFPRVVDVDVDVPGFLHSITCHRIGNSPNSRVVDPTGKLVPTVPTHWRSLGESIPFHRSKGWWFDSSRQRSFT